MKVYIKKEYAFIKGVSASRISKLIKEKKLKTKEVAGVEFIIDCNRNDVFFSRPAWNRKNQ